MFGTPHPNEETDSVVVSDSVPVTGRVELVHHAALCWLEAALSQPASSNSAQSKQESIPTGHGGSLV